MTTIEYFIDELNKHPIDQANQKWVELYKGDKMVANGLYNDYAEFEPWAECEILTGVMLCDTWIVHIS